MDLAERNYEDLKREWTDRLVEVVPDHPALKRFEGVVGRVITVNCNKKAVVDFQDGGWYDITASTAFLRVLGEDARAKYDANANSAQPIPDKQGA